MANIRFIVVLIFLGLLSLESRGATPEESLIQVNLNAARAAWNVDESMHIIARTEPLNSCVLRDIPHIAEMQWQDVQTYISIGDGSTAVSHQLTYVIRLNSNCDWSRVSLSQTILHEVGHVVIGADWHSSDRHSIMYYIVGGRQSITDADRAMIRSNREISSSR